MFLNDKFWHSRAKSSPELNVFDTSMKNVLKEVCCGKLGLIFGFFWRPLTIFNSHSRASTTLKLHKTITMGSRMVSFDLVFYKPRRRLLLLTFNNANMVVGFRIGIPSQKSENHEPNHSFHGNQSFLRRLTFGQAVRKTLLEWILRRVTVILLRGSGWRNVPGRERVN